MALDVYRHRYAPLAMVVNRCLSECNAVLSQAANRLQLSRPPYAGDCA